MFWSICLTNSYSKNLNLLEIKSAKLLCELFRYVIKGNNIVLSDDINNSSIQTIAEKIDKEVCPEYSNILIELIIELKKWLSIEPNFSDQKKIFSIPIINEEDDIFLEEARNANVIDAAIIKQGDIFLKELSTESFEIIEDHESGLDLANTISKALKYSNAAIPTRNKENIIELKKILLDSNELNYVGYNFIDSLINNNDYQIRDTILFLSYLFISNIIHNNDNKYNFNIITPMDNRISIDELKNGLQEIFSQENRTVRELKRIFENKNANVNFYAVHRDKEKNYMVLHTRGIFTKYCKIGTEWDYICNFMYSNNQGKVKSINRELRLSYANEMNAQKIINLRDNPTSSTKIKII